MLGTKPAGSRCPVNGFCYINTTTITTVIILIITINVNSVVLCKVLRSRGSEEAGQRQEAWF